MKFVIKNNTPRLGEERTIKRFIWWPIMVECNDKNKSYLWLEFATVKQRYSAISFGIFTERYFYWADISITYRNKE